MDDDLNENTEEIVLPVAQSSIPQKEEEEELVSLKSNNTILIFIPNKRIDVARYTLLGKCSGGSADSGEIRESISEVYNDDLRLYIERVGSSPQNAQAIEFIIYTEPEASRIKQKSPCKIFREVSCVLKKGSLIETRNGQIDMVFDNNFSKKMKNINNSGIVMTYQIAESPDNWIEFCFYFDKSRVFDSFENADEKLDTIYRSSTALIINHIFMYTDNYLTLEQKKNLLWIDINISPSTSQEINEKRIESDIPKMLNSIEYATNNIWMIDDDRDKYIPNYKLNNSSLHCTLMNYQKDTIRWMMKREISGEVDYSTLLNWILVPVDDIYYFPGFGIFTKINKIRQDLLNIHGGILADEMGLGKTIEVLGLIVSHMKGKEVEVLSEDVVVINNEGDHESSSKYEGSCLQNEMKKNEENWKEYHNAKKVDKTMGSFLIYDSLDNSRNSSDESNAEVFIQCNDCTTNCVKAKCNWKPEFKEISPFICPQCMGNKVPIEVKTTLIILPEPLVLQWFDEISKHCTSNLKVMFYFGLNKHGYLHPYEIANHDIILTTYDTLRQELDHTNTLGAVYQRKLRNSSSCHKFSPSSLTHVVWWRIVVDESQLVEGAARKVPKMCAKMRSNYYWCVTGTPMVKLVADIHGLFKFLRVWPFCSDLFWDRYAFPQYLASAIKSIENMPRVFLLDFCAQIMRRNTKKSVDKQVSLPSLNQIEIKLRFSAIEERQYKEEMDKVKDIIERIISNNFDDTSLSSLVQRERVFAAMNRMRQTLLSLGEHNYEKRFNSKSDILGDVILGPEAALLNLIKKKKTKVEEALREYILAKNGNAGLQILNATPIYAVVSYRDVIEVIQEIMELNKYVNENMVAIGMENPDLIDSDEEMEDEDQSSKNLEAVKRRRLRKKEVRRTLKEIIQMTSKVASTESIGTNSGSISHRIAEHQNEYEADGCSPEKKRKSYDLAELEKSSEKRLERLKKKNEVQACKPIRIDGTFHSHLILNLYKLFNYKENKEVPEITENMLKQTGGEQLVVSEFLTNANRYCRTEYNFISTIHADWPKWKRNWEDAGNEIEAVVKYLKDVGDRYTNKNHSGPQLSSKIFESNQTAPLIMQLPIIPTFTNPTLKPEKACKLKFVGKNHDKMNCMGFSSYGEIEEVFKDENQATTSELISNLTNHLRNVEKLRLELFNDFEIFNRVFLKKAEARKSTFYTIRSLIEELFSSKDEFYNLCCCIHSPLSEQRFFIIFNKPNETYCPICRLGRKIAFLQYESGIGSYHGEIRPRSAIYGFIKHITNFERRSNPSHDFKPYLKNLRDYLNRLRQTLIMFSQSITGFWEYGNRWKELINAGNQFTIEQIREWNKTKVRQKNEEIMRVWKESGSGKEPQLESLEAKDEDIIARAINNHTICASNSSERLKSTQREVKYLVHLFCSEMNGSFDEHCLICQQPIMVVVIFPCGHRTCEECFVRLKEISKTRGGDWKTRFQCCTCRAMHIHNSVMIAKTSTDKDTVIPGITLTVKLEKTIRLIFDILEKDHTNKVIVFTTMEPYTPIWRFLLKVFNKAKVPFVEMSRRDYGKRVHKFEFSEDSNVLLCSLSNCANGLNLTSANHMIFLDPAHHKSVIDQAIGRMNRYGQKREMFVYHMLVETSIDEELWKVANRNDGFYNKKDNDWTLGDIREIFGLTKFPSGNVA